MRKVLITQRGQALIELIIFLPLIVSFYAVISGFANSINGSINQQKIARAYFYNRLQNNSTFPGPGQVGGDYKNWELFSFFFIGWKESFKGPGDEEGSPLMSCYKVNVPFRNGPSDKCEDTYKEARSLWVRVGTVYGVCGATYYYNGNKIYYAPDLKGSDFSVVVDRRSCIIK
jgi:hypothetical protein